MRADRPVPSPIRSGLVVAVIASALALVACSQAPAPAPTSTGDPTPDITTLGASPGAEPSPSATPAAEIGIPVRCEDIYSTAMLTMLQSENPPLNDPGVTMDSTEVPEALDIVRSGAQTLRCSWGLPSSYGLATNVTIVDEAQATTVRDALEGAGFACGDLAGGTVCRQQNEDEENSFGETHYLQGNGWVSTRWINFGLRGYTEDIVATIWK